MAHYIVSLDGFWELSIDANYKDEPKYTFATGNVTLLDTKFDVKVLVMDELEVSCKLIKVVSRVLDDEELEFFRTEHTYKMDCPKE